MRFRSRGWLAIRGLFAFVMLFAAPSVHAQLAPGVDSFSRRKVTTGDASASASAVTPDLFSGTLSSRIPIGIPPARGGMAPELAITYSSANGNGLLGMGWSLELGGIERKTNNGVRYDRDDYVLKTAGGAAELTAMGNGEFRPLVEGSFVRVRKLTAADGNPYFEATDRRGVKYFYGTSTTTRQYQETTPPNIFRWCLERMQDPDGNYVTFTYRQDYHAIFPTWIQYGGEPGMAPTSHVRFYVEDRGDHPVSYAEGFGVRLAYRLRTIDVIAGGSRVRAYRLTYANGATTSRSVLAAVREYGADAVLDSGGEVTSGTALPPSTFQYSAGATSTNSWDTGPRRWLGESLPGAQQDIGRLMTGDFNGDGRMDIAAMEGANGLNTMGVYYSTGTGFTTSQPGPLISLPGDHEGLITRESQFKLADFNGDGRTDIALLEGWGTGFPGAAMSIYYAKPSGMGFETRVDGPPRAAGGTHEDVRMDAGRLMVGDFNGDGKADFIAADGWDSERLNGNNPFPMNVYLSNGNGFEGPLPVGPGLLMPGDRAGLWDVLARVKLGDFNGDGRTDVAIVNGWGRELPMSLYFALPDGRGFRGPFEGPLRWVGDTHDSARIDAGRMMVGEFNGDGKSDFAALPWGTGSQPMVIYLSKGEAFETPTTAWGPAVWMPGDYAGLYDVLARMKPGDFDGDGKTDIAVVEGWGTTGTPISIHLSRGDSFAWVGGPVRPVGDTHDFVRLDCSRILVGDVNGDGKDDFSAVEGWVNPLWETFPSTDGAEWDMKLYLSPPAPPDLMSRASNRRGAWSDIEYSPSTRYWNTRLPYPVQTVSAITTNVRNADDSVTVATTSILYAGGYFHVGEREFRGFSYVRVEIPTSNSSERLSTETWFHQGNDVAPGVNDPSVPTGHMKGRPWKTRIGSSDPEGPNGQRYTETITTYWTDASASVPWIDADGRAPWFTPVQRIETTSYEEGRPVLQTRTEYPGSAEAPGYDDYGNVIREERNGDVSTALDDVTIVRTFRPNVDAHIVALPATEDVYQTRDSKTVHLAGKWFYYDGIPTVAPSASDAERAAVCDNASTTAQPTKGHLTRAVSWGCYAKDWTTTGTCTAETNPETRTGYDTLGNAVCTRSPRGGVATFRYDSTATYATSFRNAKGHTTTTSYYGIDGNAQDYGRSGQVKSVTDPNLAVTTSYYDALGRKVREVTPGATTAGLNDASFDLAVRTWQYGTYTPPPSDGEDYRGALEYVFSYVYSVAPPVGATTVLDANSLVTWSGSYMDGLGRSTLERTPGPLESGWNVDRTKIYDESGALVAESLPHLSWVKTPRFITYRYDVFGRKASTTTPSGTSTSCFWGPTVTVGIDENHHRKRVIRDALGRIGKVEEYLGTFTTCTTEAGSPYATTTYGYDPLGRLTLVSDAKGNVTEIQHDSLGRKRYVHDPDMGILEYRYDEAGNVVWEQDPVLRPKGRSIAYAYDSLDRMTSKTFPDRTQVVYDYDTNYDTATGVAGLPPAAPVGRLTRMTDASGVETYRHDGAGRLARTIRTIAGTTHPVLNGYDALGRVAFLVYPDGERIDYSYDAAGNLLAAGSYASYAGHNALGQAKTVTYGNGVTTTYDFYDATDSRLKSMVVCKADPTGVCVQPPFSSTSYGYDPVGNVTSVTDALDASRSQTFGYDELDRLVSAQSAAYGALSYAYDTIGNITSKEGITYTYSPVPHSLLSTAGDRPHATLSTTDRPELKYDLNGNTLSDTVRTITYDLENRPVSVTRGNVRASFVYDGAGNRVTKTTSAGTVTYVGKLLECTASACGKYIFAGGVRIALKTGADVKYYHPNHLGSTVVVTDSTGSTALEQITYFPYGSTRSDTGVVSMSHKFTGQELDPESGLYHYGARYYDPQIGRFISPDSIIASGGSPQGLNRYSYVYNNPIRYQDPSGHIAVVDDMVVGAFVGAVVGGTMAAITGENVWKGMAMGAVSGAFFGVGSGVIGLAGIESAAASAGIYAATGAASGAINARISGANAWRGAAYGGGLGLAGAIYPVPQFQWFGPTATSKVASMANRVLNAAIMGAAYGAAQAGMSDGNVGRAALLGAASWGLGAVINMGVGHTVGYLASGHGPTTFVNGVFVYDVSIGSGPVTFSNVIIGSSEVLDSPNQVGGRRDPNHSVRDHEIAHMKQDTILGPAYIPAHAVSLLTGGIIGLVHTPPEGMSRFGNGTHEFGLLERGLIDVPCW